MKKCLLLLFFSLILSNTLVTLGQQNNYNSSKNWFVSLDLGVQMSGIKDEDFIKSNYSSLVRLTGGKWLNSKVGIQLGYQGRYFNAIADNDKHFYDFYFIEGIIDAKNILSLNKKDKIFYELLFHAGFGFFQNHYYGNSSIHSILGCTNNFTISENVKIKFDIGAIIGWDIYQGNRDILPSLSFGVVYDFDKL